MSIFNLPKKENSEIKQQVEVTEVVTENKGETVTENKDKTKVEEKPKSKIYSLADVKPEKYTDKNIISLRGINQRYPGKKKGEEIVIFEDFNLDIPDVKDLGQFVVILGPSGCGKSTLLRYITGLQQPTSGDIFIGDHIRTEKDRVGMVFQSYSSLPWYSVIKNVALGLLYKGVNKKEAYAKAQEIINLVGLAGHENKYAQYPILSGGQLQRVAIARSLATNDEILVMDEPYGALDIKTKLTMEDLLVDIFVKMPGDPTIIFVTHDIAQAVYLADEIIILNSNPGRIHKMIEIDLPYIRTFKLKRDPKFIKYVQDIEDIMYSLEENS